MDFIDLIIIALFLIATFSIGVYYGRGIKTFQTYAVGSRKMSVPVITLSLLATTYGGGILSSAPNDYYHLGLYAFMMDLASPINFYFASRFVLSRMKEFIYNLSIAESMGVIYGPVVRVVTALFGIVMTVSLLTVQVKFGQIVITELLSSHTTDLPSHYTAIALLILSLLFIGYATFGGARSVAVTDVYQFLLFGLCFPVLIFLFLNHTKDFIAGWQKLIALPVYNPIKVFQWNDILKGILIYIFYRTIFPFDPARIHRFYMSSSPQQAVKVFNRSALIRVLLAFLFLSLAISLHISGHVIDRNCNVMRYIIKLAYFPGMHGILVSVIMALLMSTADSNLHVASVLFANDIYPVLIGGNPSLKIIRTASVTIGIVSVIVAWHTSDALIPFLYKAVSVYGPVVTVPFIMTCLGFRPRSIVVLLNMLVHAMVASYRIYVGYVGSEKLVFESIILSVLSLLVAHYILPKKACTGWIGIKDSSIWDLQNQVIKRWLLKQSRKWIGYFNTDYWKAIFPRKQSTFVWLGGYMIISTLIMLYCIKQHYFWPYIYSYMTVMVIGSIIVLYPALHCYQEGGVRLLRKLWPVLLFLLLFVFSMQFLKLSHYRPIVCALWVVNLCLAIVLLSLEIGIMMSFVAIMLHNIVPPSISFRELSLAGFTMLSMEHVLAMLLTTAVVVGFGTYKYLRDQSASKFKVMNLARNYEHTIGIEAIYNKANCHRIDSYYGNQLFQEMIAKLEASHDYLVKHGQQELIQDIAMLRQSMYGFHELFLQKSKTKIV
ncbi:MAG: sodium:solute symporter family protein [Candidatus Cardinium sp.]|nr:sodium:solute symporter family protein [Candidatus Cardinium sp.]